MTRGVTVPVVSWLIACHKADKFLRVSLDSCFRQDFENFELLLVANGLQAEAIAQEVKGWYPTEDRLRILSTSICHLTFSLSLGLHHARAPLVARMDADDISDTRRLTRQVAFLERNPEVVVLGSAYEFVDADGRTLEVVAVPLTDKQIRRSLPYRNPICHPSVMFRRKAVLELGGYLGGVHAQDYDLWARLALNKANQMANIPDVLLKYRKVSTGTARRSRSAYAAASALQWRNFLSGAGFAWALGSALTAAKSVGKVILADSILKN